MEVSASLNAAAVGSGLMSVLLLPMAAGVAPELAGMRAKVS